MRQVCRLYCGLLLILSGAFAKGEDSLNWPQFRGARTNGLARGAALPETWTDSENIVWKATIPGLGWSQPIVWGERIFVTTAVAEREPEKLKLDWSPGATGLTLLLGGAGAKVNPPPPDMEYQWKLLCLDAATGQVLWDRTVKKEKPKFHVHPSNSYASETPATDGKVVIASFGMAGLYCFDMEGEQLWSKDLGVFPTQLGWGTGSSPTLHDGRIFVQYDNDATSFVTALDTRTGDELWRDARDEKSNWATPYLWRNRVRTELVVAGGGKMRSYDPETGMRLWEMNASGRTAATPVGNEELLFVDSYERMTGRTGTLAAIRCGAAGDISLKGKETTSASVAWSIQHSGYRVASPTLFDGRLYAFDQNGGIVHCFDAKTGEKVFRQRLPAGKGVMASPIATDNGLYVLNFDGVTTILDSGPELKVRATNTIDDLCWASMAVAGNRLLIRGATGLYCVGGK